MNDMSRKQSPTHTQLTAFQRGIVKFVGSHIFTPLCLAGLAAAAIWALILLSHLIVWLSRVPMIPWRGA